MPKKAPPKNNGFVEWWKTTSWAVKVVFPFSLIVSAGAAVKTWLDYDFWRPASVQYVNTETKILKPTLRDIQIEMAQGKIEQTDELLFKWNKELLEGRGDKALIKSRIKELEATKEQLKEQISTLKALKKQIDTRP